MPLGCEYHYVIFRKDSLQSSKERLAYSSDGESLAFVNALLAHRHADEHLVALQDEDAGFSSETLTSEALELLSDRSYLRSTCAGRCADASFTS